MPLADLGSSFESFFNAAAEFFRHLSEIDWTAVRARPALPGGDAARPRLGLAQRPARRLPGQPISFLPLSAAYLAGAGINAIIPAHAGDVTKVFLVKRQIPGSSYPAVTSSFLVQTRLRHHGRGPRPRSTRSPRACCRSRRSSPTCPPSRSPSGPNTRRSSRSSSGAAAGDRDRHLPARPPRAALLGRGSNRGSSILAEPRRYLREVAAWQGVGWLCRFAAFWFFLEAFGIGGSFGNVMLVMSVQAIANIVPFTPGGAGAQQALLVATLHGPSRTAVLSFSVGTQIAMAAWSVVLGFAAILLVFRTTDWRGLIQAGQQDEARRRKRRRRAPSSSSTSPGSGRRPATARAAVRRAGTRSGCGRAGSRAGPGRGRPRAGPRRPRRRRPGPGRRGGRAAPSRGSGGRASRRARPSRASGGGRATSVKAVVRRPEAVRWGPAATAQLSRRQRRKSTGTRGRPEGPGSASGAGARARASRASGQP